MKMFRLTESLLNKLGFALRMLCCVVLAFSAVLMAEENVAENNTETLIVVGRDQSEQSLNDVDITRYTGFAKVIGRSEFEDRFTTFPELLNDIPDVQIRQFGGVGSNAVITIQGSTGKQVNVFLDGFLLNSAFSGSPNMDSIPTILVERVEIFPGFTPINLSNASIAGAVNFKTRDLTNERLGGQASIAYGSFSTQQLELSSWFDIGDWQTLVAGSMVESDNDFDLDEKLFEGSPPIFATPTRRRVNDSYENKNLFFKLGKDFGAYKVSLLGQYFEDVKQVPSIKNNVDLDDAELSTDNFKVQGLLEYQFYEVSLLHRFFYSQEQAVFTDSNGSIGLNLAGTDQLTEQDAYGMFNVLQYMFAGHEVSVSLDSRHDEMYQVNRLDDEVKVDGGRNAMVLAVGDNYFFSERWQLSGDFRWYQVSDSLDYHEADVDADTSLSASAWHLGTQFFLQENLQLKLNIGESVRIPTLMEKFSNTGLYEGNPDLSEEQAQLIDAGFIFSTNVVTLDANMFFKKLEDGIYILYNSQGVASPDNTGESQIGGVSSNLLVSMTETISFTANALFMDSENLSEVKSFEGNKMPGIYHENYGFGFVYQGSWLRVSSSYQIFDELYYLSNNSFKADVKELVDVSITFYLEPITLDITARNVLDENYLDYNRMPTPGASYMATLSFNF